MCYTHVYSYLACFLCLNLFSFYIFFLLVLTAFSQIINVNRGERDNVLKVNSRKSEKIKLDETFSVDPVLKFLVSWNSFCYRYNSSTCGFSFLKLNITF